MQLHINKKFPLKKLLGVFTFVLLIYVQTNTLYGQVKPTRQTKPTKQVKPVQPITTIYPRIINVAEGYEAVLDSPSVIIKPTTLMPDKIYPLLIYMPYTGGSASDFYSQLGESINISDSFIIMLPPNPCSEQDHSWQGFEAATFRYENRILEDIKTLSTEGILDISKIILIGYSMGGDMSWAIAQRHPEIFKGAIICGSRTSWAEKNAMERIKKYGLKYYFCMGTEEWSVRLDGLNSALKLLDKNQIPYKFERVEGEHVHLTLEMIQAALSFILE